MHHTTWTSGPRLIALVATLVAILLIVLNSIGQPPRAEAAGSFAFPAPEGTEWAVLSGYNTATHSMADKGDPYALDISRTDETTGGTLVLAPMSGTVSYSSGDCMSIPDADRVALLICHLFPRDGIRGKTVAAASRSASSRLRARPATTACTPAPRTDRSRRRRDAVHRRVRHRGRLIPRDHGAERVQRGRDALDEQRGAEHRCGRRSHGAPGCERDAPVDWHRTPQAT